jgi:hypothetical protein
MPSFAVRPDDVGIAATLTARDGPALDEARRLVSVAVGSALASSDGVLAAAVQGFGQVETAVLAVLGEATAALAAGLGSAAEAYASADAAVASGLGGGR